MTADCRCAMVCGREPFRDREEPSFVSIVRTARRLVAWLMVGLLVFAQTALATHACSIAFTGPSEMQGQPVFSGTNEATLADAHAQESGAGRSKVALTNLCVGHCQPAQPDAADRSATIPPPASSTAFYTLHPLTKSASIARRTTAAAPPATLADPPHAILHCCWRI